MRANVWSNIFILASFNILLDLNLMDVKLWCHCKPSYASFCRLVISYGSLVCPLLVISVPYPHPKHATLL